MSSQLLFYIFHTKVISKSQIKLIKSLSVKKFRDEENLFVAEGTKLVADLSVAFKIKYVFATSEWLQEYEGKFPFHPELVSEDEIHKISNQKSPQGILAVFVKDQANYEKVDFENQLSLALDDVQDPGNFGTIIRIADWFGIRDIFCSEHTADAFGPKTIQATMGALSRVRIHYVNLPRFLAQANEKTQIYGTFLNGKNMYSSEFKKTGIIVMGNEGNGISPEVERFISHRLFIPNFPEGEPTSESLNVAVATAIICAEFRRK